MRVAVAATPEQRSQGLRHVEELDGYEGMLFVFDDPRSATFGMEDTLIALDIWWFDSAGLLLGSTDYAAMRDHPLPQLWVAGGDRLGVGDTGGRVGVRHGVTTVDCGKSLSLVTIAT